MIRKSVLVLMGLALLEIVIFVFAAGRFGVVNLLLVVAAMSVAGAVVLVRQVPGSLRRSVDDLVTSASATAGPTGDPMRSTGDAALIIVAALLLFFPGLITGLIGGLLLLSPVRSAARPLIAARFTNLIPTDLSESFGGLGGLRHRSDVVDVTYTTKGSNQGNASTGARHELP